MLRIAIVEDMDAEREQMQQMVKKYLSEHGLEAELFLFSDGADFVDEYPAGLDLVFLDIEMKQVSGVLAAHKIREFDEYVQILFVTNMVQYALEGYSVDAADFIVKPVVYQSFASRVDKVLKKLAAQEERSLTVKQGKGLLRCSIRELAYVESLNKKTILHKRSGEELCCSEPLYALEKKLEGEAFFRCHNAFLVNLDCIETLSGGDVVVLGKAIPVSKYRKKEFMTVLANYRGRML